MKSVIFDEKMLFLKTKKHLFMKKRVFLNKHTCNLKKWVCCPAERDHHSQADSWYHSGTILVPFWYHLTSENGGVRQLRFVYIWWEFVRMMFEAWGTILYCLEPLKTSTYISFFCFCIVRPGRKKMDRDEKSKKLILVEGFRASNPYRNVPHVLLIILSNSHQILTKLSWK